MLGEVAGECRVFVESILCRPFLEKSLRLIESPVCVPLRIRWWVRSWFITRKASPLLMRAACCICFKDQVRWGAASNCRGTATLLPRKTLISLLFPCWYFGVGVPCPAESVLSLCAGCGSSGLLGWW